MWISLRNASYPRQLSQPAQRNVFLALGHGPPSARLDARGKFAPFRWYPAAVGRTALSLLASWFRFVLSAQRFLALFAV